MLLFLPIIDKIFNLIKSRNLNWKFSNLSSPLSYSMSEIHSILIPPFSKIRFFFSAENGSRDSVSNSQWCLRTFSCVERFFCVYMHVRREMNINDKKKLSINLFERKLSCEMGFFLLFILVLLLFNSISSISLSEATVYFTFLTFLFCSCQNLVWFWWIAEGGENFSIISTITRIIIHNHSPINQLFNYIN